MKFCGIDRHSNNSVIVVSDAEDRTVLQRRLPNELGAILAVLAPHCGDLAGVVVESTYNWYWLVDGLADAGYRTHLAHVAAIKRYEGLKHSGDAADAAYLAQLLRLGMLPEGYIYPREQRAARDLARKRIQLVRCRTAHIVSMENLLARHTGARPSCAQIRR
ncbi:transposase [Paraburkholderia sediminicola]|uniref:IS110 family transposase n=1 Tax=Paraburkholderia sediminicola TaxID=458836 RepID=UPI0038BD0F1F